MLTTDEIKKLTEYQVEVFKDVFATKDDIKGLEIKINNVQTSLDIVLKDKKTFEQEQTVASHRIKDLEDWTDKAASKLNIRFEH